MTTRPACRSTLPVTCLIEAKYFIQREIELDDQARVSLSLSQKRVPRTSSRKSRTPSESPAVLLQLYTASPSIKIWSGAEDAGDAGWVGEPATVVPRDLYGRGRHEVFRCRWGAGRFEAE